MTDPARDRAAYLDQVTALLWPAPATVTRTAGWPHRSHSWRAIWLA